MAKLTKLEEAVWDTVLKADEPLSVRQVQDTLETPERGTQRLQRGEVRNALEHLVSIDLVDRDKDLESDAVTYRTKPGNDLVLALGG